MRTLLVSANAATLRSFAESLIRECDAAMIDKGTARESIEVEMVCEHNGSGPQLVIRFDNDDMERNENVEDGQAIWEEGD